MTIEERLQPALQLKPEIASLNMGSMNFGLYPMLKRFPAFRFDWERPYLAGSEDRIFKNTFKDIEYILTSCADNGTRFEIECYDIGHLYTAAHFFERGVVKPPLFIQSVFGILGGIGAASRRRRAHEAHGRPALRRSVPVERARRRAAISCRSRRCRRRWAATCASGWRTACGSDRASSPNRTPRRCAPCGRSSRRMGLDVATPDDARQILALKGRGAVAF